MQPRLAFGETFGDTCAAALPAAVVSLSVHAPHQRTPPHRHANDYVCIVLAGDFEQRAGSAARKFGAGDVVYTGADDWHEDRFEALGARCLNIHFAGEAAALRYPCRCNAEARLMANLLAAEVALADTADRLRGECLLAELLGALAEPREAPAQCEWLAVIVDALNADTAGEWSLRALARLADRHPTHVARAFRARTGLSISAYRRRCRLRELLRRLRHDDAPLAQLAAELGYADQAHMTREFSAHTGVSPAAYRRARR
jgi:AraC family transcriptional regulator